MLLAFVPARGGSKGIPRKNLAVLAGRPLIQYTLEAALGSSSVDEIFVSTDDEEIARFCERLGIVMHYRRPAELAGDDSPLMPAIEHGLRAYERDRGRLPEELLLLQPTSPLRIAQDIDGAVAEFRSRRADSLVGVHRMAEHPYECVKTLPGGWDYLEHPPQAVTRRQDYQGGYFFINGALYLVRTDVLLMRRTLIEPGVTHLYEMPRERGIDVDSPLELAYAEALLASRN